MQTNDEHEEEERNQQRRKQVRQDRQEESSGTVPGLKVAREDYIQDEFDHQIQLKIWIKVETNAYKRLDKQ